MRQLNIMEHISLDGVIQHSADGDDFPYGDWTAPYRSPAGREAVMAAQADQFDLLLGRRTYDIWASYWPTAPSSPIGDPINAATKYVATHHPESLHWGPSVALGRNIVEEIRQLKSQQGPDIVLWGSSTLITTLLDHGLADHVVLIVYPIQLGSGKRFFAEGATPRTFSLISHQALPNGVVINTYQVLGA